MHYCTVLAITTVRYYLFVIQKELLFNSGIVYQHKSYTYLLVVFIYIFVSINYFRYVKVLVNHPRRVIAIVVLLCSSTILIPYFMGRLPQISHPELVSCFIIFFFLIDLFICYYYMILYKLN